MGFEPSSRWDHNIFFLMHTIWGSNPRPLVFFGSKKSLGDYFQNASPTSLLKELLPASFQTFGTRTGARTHARTQYVMLELHLNKYSLSFNVFFVFKSRAAFLVPTEEIRIRRASLEQIVVEFQRIFVLKWRAAFLVPTKELLYARASRNK